MNMAALFVGFATGMLLTRRTGPLAGAGVLALVLPLTIWVSGAPFAVAIVGVFVYRVLALLLPMPVSLAALPTLAQAGRGPAQAHRGAGRARAALRDRLAILRSLDLTAVWAVLGSGRSLGCRGSPGCDAVAGVGEAVVDVPADDA